MNGKEFDETSDNANCEGKKKDRLVGLRDEAPIGPLQAVRDMRRKREGRKFYVRRSVRNNDVGRRRQEGGLTRQMTVAAIGVDFGRLVGVIRQLRVGIMLVAMVAEMLGCLFLFMLAIDSHRSPRELER